MELKYRNIILARESRGITQSELAAKVNGLTQGNLSRMEKGLFSISDDILNSISEVTNYPIHFFFKEIITTKDDSLFYRKRNSMSQKQLSKLEAKIDVLSMVIDELMRSVDIPEFNIPHAEINCDKDVDSIAFNLRKYLNIPSGPIEDIISLVEKQGVIVSFIEIDSDKFDGLTKFTTKGQPIIWINKDIPNDRKRFTIAHELGHLVMHLRSNNLEIDEFEAEKQANKFAAEFMLPISDCKKDFLNLKYKDLSMLKQFWKMSKASILYRAFEIGSISQNTFRYYFMTLNKTGERKNESGIISIAPPVILNKMVDLHLNVLGYNRNEMTELLGLYCDEITTSFDTTDAKRLKIAF